MSGGPALDLDAAVDGQRFGPHTILFLTITTLALVGDGFDFAAIGYVAPALTRFWGLAPQALVPAFSAGIVGMMIGGPLMGWLGDRWGRRRLVLAGLVAVGLLTLATTTVGSVTALTVLRLFTGVGLGGVIPNVIALVAELGPTRARGRRRGTAAARSPAPRPHSRARTPVGAGDDGSAARHRRAGGWSPPGWSRALVGKPCWWSVG